MAWFITHNGFIMMKSAILHEQAPCRHVIKIIFIIFQFTLLAAYPFSGIAVQIFCGAFIVLQGLRVSNDDKSVLIESLHCLSIVHEDKRKLAQQGSCFRHNPVGHLQHKRCSVCNPL